MRLRPLVVAPVALVLLAGTGAGAWAVLDDDDTDPAATEEPTEQLVEATVGDLEQTVSADGAIEAETTTEEAFTSAGTVTEVLVAEGDEVAAGAVLARIDSAELDAAVTSAQAALDEAEAARDEAEDGDATDTEVAARQAQVDAAEADLVAAVDALAGAALTSPVDGTVASVGYQVGDVLGADGTDGTDTGPSAPTEGDEDTTPDGIQIVSTGTYVVTIDVDATQVDQLEVGQVAHVTPTTSSSSSGAGPLGGFGPIMGGPMAGGALPEERGEALAEGGADQPEAVGAAVDGLVTSVGAVASTDSGVATFPVEIVVHGSPDEFFPGAVAEVEVVHETIADAVTVPVMAVRQVDGQATVTVADGDEREDRPVTTGVTSGGMVQVVEGLEAGEQVVVTRPGGATAGPAGGPVDGPVVMEGGP